MCRRGNMLTLHDLGEPEPEALPILDGPGAGQMLPVDDWFAVGVDPYTGKVDFYRVSPDGEGLTHFVSIYKPEDAP